MKSKLFVVGVVVIMSIALFGCQGKTETENAVAKIVVAEEKNETDVQPEEEKNETDVQPEAEEKNEMDVQLGASSVYTEEQLSDAINVITDTFDKDFEQCTLQKIVYDEEYSISMEEMNKEMYQVENAVVFTCTFVVDEDYANGPMNAGAVYEDYEWIMTMDEDGNWSVISCGYQ